MPITIDNTILKKKLRSFKSIFNSELNENLKNAGKRILSNSQNRFSSHFSGSKFSDVLNAIKSSGVKVQQSSDDKTTFLFIADMSILDQKTQLPPTIAQGNIYHFWRILHEGAGLIATATNPHIYISGRKSIYPIQVILQTSILGFTAGRQAPFPELLTLEGSGVFVLRHRGFSGHQWFLNNLSLFDSDRLEIDKAVEIAIKNTIKRSGMKV